jgi:hypothetical protein
MHQRNLVLAFAGKFALVYYVLIAPWPGFAARFSRWLGEQFSWDLQAFVALLHHLYDPFGGTAVVDFRPNEGLNDARLFVCRADSLIADGTYRTCGSFFTSTRYLGYLALALMVALVLASPVSWKRRAFALAGGIVAVHVLVAVKVWIILLSIVNATPSLRMAPLAPFWKPTLNAAYQNFVIPLGPMFTLVVLCWVAVCFRRSDLDAILGKQAAPAPARGAAAHPFVPREDLSAGAE